MAITPQGAESDYINASLLQSKPGEAPPWAYVATQAPLPSTAAHFWACVWHQHSGVVRSW
jgi:protein tyrosine phosphatase